MADRALRGSNLGARSMETDENVVPSERQITVVRLPAGPPHRAPLLDRGRRPARPGSAAAASRPSCATAPSPRPSRSSTVRTHWDMLLERRSIPELEELLEERLTLLRESRGEKPRAQDRLTRPPQTPQSPPVRGGGLFVPGARAVCRHAGPRPRHAVVAGSVLVDDLALDDVVLEVERCGPSGASRCCHSGARSPAVR